MYDQSDPRARLAEAPAGTATAQPFAPAEFGLFYETPPQLEDAASRTWLTRGQNFLVAYTEAKSGAALERAGHPDEYVLMLPDRDTPATVEAGDDRREVSGYSLVVVPPGDSRVTLPSGGRAVRITTTRAGDLAALCANAEAYREPNPVIPPFEPWPAPADGYRIRVYSLDVPPEPGRFGRIFRCSTLMVNVLDPQMGPRDTARLSPHHHDEFEQGSLALDGAFTHHLRWPWTTNLDNWREDQHALCRSPSLTVIPPPAIHTSRGMEEGLNQLVDIFAPPREDFSNQAGWVLNADEYPPKRE